MIVTYQLSHPEHTLRHKGSSLHPVRKGLQEKDKVWLVEEQKCKKKLCKLLE